MSPCGSSRCMARLLPQKPVFQRGSLQLDGLRRPAEELGAGGALLRWLRSNQPFGRRLYERLRMSLVTRPQRRLMCAQARRRRARGLPLTPAQQHADVRVDRFRLHARYRPGVIRTPTDFFNPVEPATDAAATWRRCLAGPFTAHSVPDPHLGPDEMRAAEARILERLAELGEA